MNLDMGALAQNQRYKLLTALVVPRPIAWISTLNAQGGVNLAPYSFFNVLGNRPPLVAIGPGYKADGSIKDTPRNISERGEFVINMVEPAVAEAMHQSAAPLEAGESEAEQLGVEMCPSVSIRTPGVAACRVRLECTHHDSLMIGDNQVVFGFVKSIYVQDGLVDPETLRIESGAFTGVGRLQGPGWYCTTDSAFDLGSFPREIAKL